MIARWVFVRSPVVSILYEMTSDMLPKIKIKRVPADIRSVWESSSRDLLEYAART